LNLIGELSESFHSTELLMQHVPKARHDVNSVNS